MKCPFCDKDLYEEDLLEKAVTKKINDKIIKGNAYFCNGCEKSVAILFGKDFDFTFARGLKYV